MSVEALKLTAYFGESDRVGGRLLSDVLVDAVGRHRVAASVLLRAVEGFGIKQQLRTQRLLTLSDDLPLVLVAVDARERIEALVPDVAALVEHGTITLERARLAPAALAGAPVAGDATKLTLYLGRAERAADGRPATAAVLAELRRHGVQGATVLLGVDGTLHGERRRARFVATNADVPVMIIAVGDGAAVAAALPDLDRLLDAPVATVEQVRLLKRDGLLLGRPESLPAPPSGGLALFGKLMVFTGEQARAEGHAQYVRLIHELRLSGAAGATALRGVVGYSHDGPPHADRLLALRRHSPIVLTMVDRPEAIERSFAIVDRLTASTGLVTGEVVPAFRATAPAIERGGLRLAGPHRRASHPTVDTPPPGE